MIAHAVEESVYYLTRDTAWGLRQVLDVLAIGYDCTGLSNNGFAKWLV